MSSDKIIQETDWYFMAVEKKTIHWLFAVTNVCFKGCYFSGDTNNGNVTNYVFWKMQTTIIEVVVPYCNTLQFNLFLYYRSCFGETSGCKDL